MVTIVDYGMGNLRSVQKAFEKIGSPAQITSDPRQVAAAEKLVLPGVGAFRDAMDQLRRAELVGPLKEFLGSGRPFFGICLGLQMLFETSYEDGEHKGLGHFPGKVVRFKIPPNYKVPHMGWNQARIVRRPPVLEGLPEAPDVYFVHSYYVEPADRSIVATETDYANPFVSMIWSGSIFATQFHPEKSQKIGLAMLRNFASL